MEMTEVLENYCMTVNWKNVIWIFYLNSNKKSVDIFISFWLSAYH